MNLNDSLKEREAKWKADADYRQDALPEVYAAYKKFVASGKFPYLTQIVDVIKAETPIDNDLLSHLKTEVYLASQQYKREQDREYKVKMEQEGWKALTPETAKQFPNGSRIKVKASREADLFTANIDAEYKTFVNEKGIAYLMKPRASAKGIPIVSLDNAYYKEVAPITKGYKPSPFTPKREGELYEKSLELQEQSHGTKGLIDAMDDPKLFRQRYIDNLKAHIIFLRARGSDARVAPLADSSRSIMDEYKAAHRLPEEDWPKYIADWRKHSMAKNLALVDWEARNIQKPTAGYESKQKAPWEMTRAENLSAAKKWRADNMPRLQGTALEDELRHVDEGHKRSVEQALASGKDVPLHVLKDYPDLAESMARQKGIKVGGRVRAGFFDSMTMKNRIEEGRVKEIRQDGLIDVEVEKPIRKRITTLISDVAPITAGYSSPSGASWRVTTIYQGQKFDHTIDLGPKSEKADVLEALKRQGVRGEVISITRGAPALQVTTHKVKDGLKSKHGAFGRQQGYKPRAPKRPILIQQGGSRVKMHKGSIIPRK